MDSASIEALWAKTERRTPQLFAAIDRGDPFADPENASILRDLVSVHLARSYRYKKIHHDSFHRAYQDLRANMLGSRRELIRSEAKRQTGLYLPNEALPSYLDQILEESLPARGFESGQLFRTNIEETFAKVQQLISTWEPEIITAKAGQFIIGDCPAVPIRLDYGTLDSVSYNMAIGDAHSIILPLGPRHLVALGPRQAVAELEKPFVNWANKLQVLAAYRHVFFKPDQSTEAFVQTVCHDRGR